MIMRLRTKERETIADVECFVKREGGRGFIEIITNVEIDVYSIFLLDNLQKKVEIIGDFQAINEMRGWLWERYFCGKDNDPDEYPIVMESLREILKEIANRHKLYYVED